jgi:hypothetical protein
MQWHVEEIASQVMPGARTVFIVDQAGWHTTKKLNLLDNIALMSVLPGAPELNPVENVWQFMPDNWLSNRVFTSHADIVTMCCEAWNKLIDQPWGIMSIGTREWDHGF